MRKPEFGVLDDDDTKIKKAELEMAHMLVESLAGDYEPDEYSDDYEQAVKEVVKAKLKGGEVKKPAAAAESEGEVIDLLAALQQSVDRAKKSRGEAS